MMLFFLLLECVSRLLNNKSSGYISGETMETAGTILHKIVKPHVGTFSCEMTLTFKVATVEH